MSLASASAGKSSDKLMSIQYVRAVASLIVVGWHTGWSYTVLGQAGVDLFFVVSGFVMMLVSGRENSPGRFGLARILRIVPLYWGVTAVQAIVDHPSARTVMTSLLFWPDGPFPLVIQGWSLNLEMLYYLLFALTLFAAAYLRLRLLMLGMVMICFGLPFLVPTSFAVATWSNPLAFEFLAGACLYRLWRGHYLPVGLAAWVMGLAAVIVFASTHLLGGAPVGWARVAFWGVPAVAIVGAGLGIERAGQLPQIKLMAYLGEASYSIYVTHLLALRFVAQPLQHMWAPVALALAIAWACLFGWIVYRVFERPAHTLTKALVRQFVPKSQPRSA